MTISLYDVAVGGFLQILPSVSSYLDKGLAHCHEHKIDPNEFVDARLYPDMAALRFQIMSVVQHSLGAIEAVKSGEFRPPSTGSLDYAGLQKHVADAQTKLKAIDRAAIENAGSNDITFKIGDKQIPFTAEGFLLSFSLPNFHFHATTAYDILRSKGVKLGKRDYLGHLRIKQ